jgi:hypothetical protein
MNYPYKQLHRDELYDSKYIAKFMSDYRRGLDCWLDIMHTLLQRVTTLYNSLLHTQ